MATIKKLIKTLAVIWGWLLPAISTFKPMISKIKEIWKTDKKK